MSDTLAKAPRMDRAAALRRSRRLTLLTLVYNLVEFVVAISAGLAASSAALVGFGLDSAIESSASMILIWRLLRERPDSCSQEDDRVAQRLIAASFVGLAVWVGQESIRQLVTGAEPEVSTVGIALAALSLVTMPLLARAKRQLAPLLGSRAAEAESQQTMLCAYLSAALLVGLSANALLGWSWADPVAGLVIAALAAREGWATWRADSLTDTCCG
ncbi:MAG: cation transporter [Euzebya sp.]